MSNLYADFPDHDGPKLVRKLFKKTLFQAVVFSVSVHLMVLLLFGKIRLVASHEKEIEIFFQIPVVANDPVSQPPIEKAEKSTENILPSINIPPQEINSESEQLPVVAAVKTDSTAQFNRTTFFVLAPQTTYKQLFRNVELDSSDTLQVNPGLLPFIDLRDSMQFQSQPGPNPDRIQRDIYQENLGHPRPLSLNNAIGGGAKYLSDLFNKKKEVKPVRLDFVPSEVELNILATLWENSRATDVEIYAALDTNIRLTAVDLNAVLLRLEEKGLVKRTLVSPRNEFTFPVGSVEMSAKNRRNRVYQYESRIDSDEVMRYLQAVLYETEYGEKSSLDDSMRTKQIAGIQEKIIRLLKVDE